MCLFAPSSCGSPRQINWDGFTIQYPVFGFPRMSFSARMSRLSAIRVSKKFSSHRINFFMVLPTSSWRSFRQADRMRQINRKLELYFEHGAEIAWLINWRKEQIIIYTVDSVECLAKPSGVQLAAQSSPALSASCAGFQGVRPLRRSLSHRRPRTVAQVSKPAVSPISKSAARPTSRAGPVWKPAIQQTRRSALRFRSAPPLQFPKR